MPNPKWRHSKRRKRARRTHFVTDVPQIATDKVTGERHLYHRAYTIDGSLYYRGQMVVEGKSAKAANAEDTES